MLYISDKFSTLEKAQQELKNSAFFLLDIHQVLFHRRGLGPLLRGIARIHKKPRTFKEGFQALCSPTTWKSLHRRFKTGNLITEAYLNAAKQKPHLHSELLNYSNNIYTADKQMQKLLSVLRQKHHELYLLSNIGNLTLERLKNSYPTYFDLMTDNRNTINRGATDDQSLIWKPQPQAYIEALHTIGKSSVAHHAIFIDDTRRHIQAAHQQGMNAILFRSFAQCKQDIEILLGSNLPL